MHLNSLNVLVLCEQSGTVRNRFAFAGHRSISADIAETTAVSGPMGNGWAGHIVADAARFATPGDDLYVEDHWDLLIAHPTCTYMTNSGVRWLFETDDRGHLTDRAVKRWGFLLDGIRFFNKMLAVPAPFQAVENPVPHRYARLGIKAGLDLLAVERPDLARLVRSSVPRVITEATDSIGSPTQVVQPWMFGHTESKATGLWLKNLPLLASTDVVKAEMAALPKKDTHKVHYASPGENRWLERSAFAPGIAQAMVDQWAPFIESAKQTQEV